ncbi:hypothetical protein HJFPF1_04859 [Paramyrothecium foliicola]|nr:hypothetical protein HJFPF1_04859 [Paramyrothecium foliicola]
MGQEHEDTVRSWGFKEVVTWTDEPPALATPFTFMNRHYTPHAHDDLSAHLVLEGEMTVLFPDDGNPKKKTYGPGERVDIGIGRLHEVWIGKDGCVSVIGR